MKIVFTLLVAAAAAAAQVDFNDDDLALIQLRSAKHPKHGHGEALVDVSKTGGAQEEANQAQADADGALALANNALNTAFQSEDDAQAAQDDAAQEAAGANANAGQADEAAAVGDPHLTLSNGKKSDLCCHGGKCKPCKPALLQQPATAEAEAAQAQQEADEAQQMADEAMQEAQDAQAEAQQAQQDAVAEAAQTNANQADEAEAVGDPHMKLSNGKKADLCCDGHLCKKCTKSEALLQHDKKVSKTHDALADAQAAEAAAQEAQAVAQQAQDEANEAQAQADAAAAAVAANGQQDVAVPVVVDPDNQEEAAAVGDPHLTLKNGEKKEMCCKGKHCKPC